uniref:Uncharacterized protein n=1 Tax=Knipowitschia caucasica TaxID=637954 RepID=A0AAV2JJM5_KNICA
MLRLNVAQRRTRSWQPSHPAALKVAPSPVRGFWTDRVFWAPAHLSHLLMVRKWSAHNWKHEHTLKSTSLCIISAPGGRGRARARAGVPLHSKHYGMLEDQPGMKLEWTNRERHVVSGKERSVSLTAVAHSDAEERTVLSSAPVLTASLIPSTCSNSHLQKQSPLPVCACAGGPQGLAVLLPQSPQRLSSLARLLSPSSPPPLHLPSTNRTH